MENSDKKNNSTWNQAYKLDIKVMDEQHKNFFAIYDELVSCKNSNQGDIIIKSAIDKLLEYTSVHFNSEELLMEKANYTDLEEQKRQHRFFITRIEDLQLAYAHKNPMLYEQLLTFIRKWFLSHISQTDSKYKGTISEYLTSKKTD